jgi:hypothetical protein
MNDTLDSPKTLDSDLVLLVLSEGVAIIELNETARFNAESHGLLTALWHKLKEVERLAPDGDVKSVVLQDARQVCGASKPIRLNTNVAAAHALAFRLRSLNEHEKPVSFHKSDEGRSIGFSAMSF